MARGMGGCPPARREETLRKGKKPGAAAARAEQSPRAPSNPPPQTTGRDPSLEGQRDFPLCPSRHEQLRASLCTEGWVAAAAQPDRPAALPALPTALPAHPAHPALRSTRHQPDSTRAKAGFASSPTSEPPLGFGAASLKGNTNQKQKEALLSCWQLCLSMSYEVLLYSWGRKKMLISSESIMFHLEPGCSRCFGRNIPLPRSPSRNFISLFHYWELHSPRFISGDGVDC